MVTDGHTDAQPRCSARLRSPLPGRAAVQRSLGHTKELWEAPKVSPQFVKPAKRQWWQQLASSPARATEHPAAQHKASGWHQPCFCFLLFSLHPLCWLHAVQAELWLAPQPPAVLCWAPHPAAASQAPLKPALQSSSWLAGCLLAPPAQSRDGDGRRGEWKTEGPHLAEP